MEESNSQASRFTFYTGGKTNLLTLLIIGLLGLVVCVETGLLINDYMYFKAIGEEYPILAAVRKTKSTTLPTVTPDTSQIENWKTYMNTKYGFEFRYPIDFSVKEELNSVNLLGGENKRITIDIDTFDAQYMELKTISKDEAEREYKTYISAEYPYFTFGVNKAIQAKKLVLTRFLEKGVSQETELVYFKLKDHSIALTLYRIWPDKSGYDNDKILSTFRLTE